MAQQFENQVRRYYDRNTSWFLGLSRRRKPKAIHQPLYTKTDMSLEEALHTHHERIREHIPESSGHYSILDLGCGVGASMIYLAHHTPESVQYIGITISGTQVAQADTRIATIGLINRIKIINGSFQSLPATIPSIDLAYGIESFIHSPDPSAFFEQVSGVLKTNGHLILFDDFLHLRVTNEKEQHILDNLKNGWLANSLLTIDEINTLANQAGLHLIADTDYTSSLRLWRIRDKCVHLIVPFAQLLKNSSEYCRFLIGGDARQRAYKKRLLQYHMLIFQKRRSPVARTAVQGGFVVDR
jgi:cyclopropane fatty-acyl-phospholipid synthase-like methyltransferase